MNFSKRLVACFLLLLLTLLTLPALTQQLPSSVLNRLGSDPRLYNGYEYIRNGTPAKGFPFFYADSLLPGSLFYDGILYPNIDLEYDLVQDQLVIRDYTGNALISLVSQKVDRFSIDGHRFRYVAAEKTDQLKSGFYEVLYTAGPAALLARHEKKLVAAANTQDQARYTEASSHFLQLHDRYYRVDGEDQLLDALQDKKAALKKYIHDNKIRFRKDLEQALIKTTDYYLQIRN